MSKKLGILKGTTTVGIVCKDGVILGTDTRATMGNFVASKRAKKVYKITDHLAMTIAGGVAVAQRVVEILRVNSRLYELEKHRSMPVQSAARLVQTLLFSNREVGAPLPMQAIIGGYDETGPHVYNLDPYGSMTEETMVSTGSGSPYAYGVLEAQYEEGKTVDVMIKVVVQAIDSAMKRDVASGDNFDVAVINEEAYRELSPEEKKEILNS